MGENNEYHNIYGGFRATIPHVIIQTGQEKRHYTEKEIKQMREYLGNEYDPVTKKHREDDIPDADINRLFRRRCINGIKQFLNVELQVSSYVTDQCIPTKKAKLYEEEKEKNSSLSKENNDNKNDEKISKNLSSENDSNIVSCNKEMEK
uniref:HUN domain-containing protein n=1 Tax=Parastrongyloides trichosuri TaxID=131310 RepID=A0A0N4ZEI9_PARTI